ncbi:hypothetical protein PLESTB_001618400 [Pleodorina starrii]|uniref:Glutathione peroxidase n=1 Tax=Pleodorina starrii TaxID=330485 RepID=A0A9W6F9C3_9CHLO|nr:hypothetical protein PLESTM_001892600 [Pleodorina starrii]GLC60481.1 hypothetical protein PLESTB_001618400 [Pleodorina starrii]GLC77253.1 hypothetical protein PLESTF_001904600 [Pleodorina starrii]
MLLRAKCPAPSVRTATKGRRSCVVCFATANESTTRRSLLLGAAAGGISQIWLPGSAYSAAEPTSAYDFSALQYEQERSLQGYRGKVIVVMNIASE